MRGTGHAGKNSEMVSTDPNDPNFGLETDDTSPNFGLAVEEPKPEGGVGAGILAGLGHALNPVNIVKGALGIGQPSDISNITRYSKSLYDIATGKGVEESLRENIPEVQQQREAAFGQQGAKAAAEYWTGAGLQAVALGVPFVHGKIRSLRETVFGEKAAPEAMPQTTEPLVSEVAAAETKLPDWAREEMVNRGLDPNRLLNDVDIQNPSVREAIEQDPTLTPEQKQQVLKTGSTEGGEISATQERPLTESSVIERPNIEEGGLPAETIGSNRPVESGEIKAETIAEPVPQPEQPTKIAAAVPPRGAGQSSDPISDTAIKTPDGKIWTGKWSAEQTGDFFEDRPIGAIHSEIESTLFENYDDIALSKSVDGFITKSGKFLDKKEAFQHVQKNKQIDVEKYKEQRSKDLGKPKDEINNLDALRFEDTQLETLPPTATSPVETATATETPQKASKIGQSIETKAVEAKLTEGFSETAGYDPITIKDQAQRATSLIESSPDVARAVVRGEAPLPEGLRGTSLITAMEEQLLKKPDPQLAYELANSPLTSATSAAAQEMRLMSERVPDSLSVKFKEIRDARQAGSKLRGETSERLFQDIQKEVIRQSSKRPTWEAFVRSIEC